MGLLDRVARLSGLARKEAGFGWDDVTGVAMTDSFGQGGWTLVAGSAGELPTRYDQFVTEGFRKNAVVSACVRVITQAMVDAPLKVYLPDGSGWSEAPDHPAQAVLESPNRKDPGIAMIERMLQHYLIGGNTLLHKIRGPGGLVTGLRTINPIYLVSALVDFDDGAPVEFTFSSNLTGIPRRIPIEDIVLVPDIDPLNEIFGLPRLLSAAMQIRADREADQYVAELMHNHGSPGLIMGVDRETKPEYIERAEDKWDEKFGPGRGRGKVAFVPGLNAGAVKEVGFSLADLEFPELRNVSSQRICAVLGVDPMLIGVHSSSGRSSSLSGAEYQGALQRLWEITIIPMFRRWEAYLNAFLAPEWGDVRLFFDLDGVQALKDDRNAAATRVQAMFSTASFSREELRAELGYDPEPDPGQEFIGPLGVMTSAPGEALDRPPPPPAFGAPPAKPADDGKPAKASVRILTTGRTVTGFPRILLARRRQLEPALKAAAARRCSGCGKFVNAKSGDSDCCGRPVVEAAAAALPPVRKDKQVQLCGNPAMTKAQKVDAWKSFDRFATSREPAYRDAARTLFRKMRAACVGAAKAHLRDSGKAGGPEAKGTTYESLLELQKALGIAKDQYHREWRQRFRALTENTTQVVGGSVAGDLGFSFNMSAQEVLDFLDSRANLLAGVSDATFDAVVSAIKDGYEAGDSSSAMADRIGAVLDKGYQSGDVKVLPSDARADLIARTETTAAANGGALAVVKSSGLGIDKEWINRGDDKVRDSHQDQPVGVGGEKVDADATFSNGCAYPGDEAGGPDETCNCRCAMLFYPRAAAAA